MQLTKEQLYFIAKVTNAEFVASNDPDEPPFVAAIAGAGEVQLSQDGSAWYFQWDRTHALSVEKELDPPDTDDAYVLAKWLEQAARKFDNAVF